MTSIGSKPDNSCVPVDLSSDDSSLPPPPTPDKNKGSRTDIPFDPTIRVNDLVLIMKHEAHQKKLGRVKEINGDTLTLKPCPSGIRKELVVPLADVIKVRDFLRGL